MSDGDFLKRWSRRKQEAKTAEQAPLPLAEPVAPPPSAPEPEIDLSKLPSLDSISAATDITDFLRQGIPAELKHAALRRAWAADPAIRDFVGLAENAWDFTDPNAMPGFGPLQSTPEQLSAMLERVLGNTRDAVEKMAEQLPEKQQVAEKLPAQAHISALEPPAEDPIGAMRQSDEREAPVAATQPEASDEDGDLVPVRRRSHGGALPS